MNGQAAKAHNTVCQWRAMIHAWGRGDNSIRKDLQHTHKDLNLTLRTQVKKLTWWAYLQSVCCRSRHRKSPGAYQPASLGKLLSLRLPRPGLKNKVNGSQDKISKVVLWLPQIQAHMCMHTYAHVHIIYICVLVHTTYSKEKKSWSIHDTDRPSVYYVKEKTITKDYLFHDSILRCPENVPVVTQTWKALEKYKVAVTGHRFPSGVMNNFLNIPKW